MSNEVLQPSEMIGPNELLFRVHARRDDHDLVSAAVFAEKLTNLIRALQEADRTVNHGILVHDYKIAKLRSTSPTVLLSEVPLRKFDGRYDLEPSINAFDSCLDAVISGDGERARKFGDCAAYVSKLARGSVKKFGYGEVWTGPKHVYRVDGFLQERATAATKIAAVQIDDKNWYKGSVFGSFDGEVRVVDTRGELPEIKLILSAGRQEIDCVCRADHIDQIRKSINKRIRIFGRAIYDGSSGLPRRVEVNNIEPVSEGADFSKWKGAFRPFHPGDWVNGDS
jgi:hypothetical protein